MDSSSSDPDSDSNDEHLSKAQTEALEAKLSSNPSNYDTHVQSVALWCDFLNFLRKYDASIREHSVTGISKARNLFERALTVSGLHVEEGNLIWGLYKDFEEAVFLTIVGTDSVVFERSLQCTFTSSFDEGILPIQNTCKVDSMEILKGREGSRPRSITTGHENDVKLAGKNTFAVPGNVKARGSGSSRGKSQSQDVNQCQGAGR